MTTGQAIQKARKSKGYSQTKVATLLGVGQTTVSFWETDRYMPSLMLAISLADVLEISLDELIGRAVRNEKS